MARRVGSYRERPAAILVAVSLAMSLVASACAGLVGSESESESESEADSSTSSQPDDLASTTTDETEPAEQRASADERGQPGLGLTCESVTEDPIGKVQNPDLIEASGVVASRQYPDLLWSHNDSGGLAGVFAFDTDGADLGFFELPVAAIDIEDIAIKDNTLYLADIGDNNRARDAVTIHVFAEPDPAAADRSQRQITDSRTVTLRYPDQPTDAEAFLVDPISGDFIVLSKDLDESTAPTVVYTAPDPGGSTETNEPVELTAAGSIDVAALTQRSGAFSLSGLAFPGAATAADIIDDGSLIALRTYGSVWLFARQPGTTIAEAFTTEPCEGGAEAETQGEAVGFLPMTDDGLVRYVTVSEGRTPAVNLSLLNIDG